MYYYSYDNNQCKLLSLLNESEKSNSDVSSNEYFDLDFVDVYVGLLSQNREIKRRTIITKSNTELIKVLKEQKEQIADLNLAIAELYGGNDI